MNVDKCCIFFRWLILLLCVVVVDYLDYVGLIVISVCILVWEVDDGFIKVLVIFLIFVVIFVIDINFLVFEVLVVLNY